MGFQDVLEIDTNDIELETLAEILAVNLQEYDWGNDTDKDELLYGDFGALHLLRKVIEIAKSDSGLRLKLRESKDRPLLKKFRVQIEKCSRATGAERETAMKELSDLVDKIKWTLAWGGLKQRVRGLNCYAQDQWLGESGFETPCFADCKHFPRDPETGEADRNQVCNFWIHPDCWGMEVGVVTWDEFEREFKTKIDAGR